MFRINGKSYAITFALVSTLFFLWGFCNGMIDVLNKHFQNSLHISKAESGFVQFANFIGYFVMAIPSGLLAKRFGYKSGIMIGLSLIASGAFFFIPATWIGTFAAFLTCLFILATGLTILETIANPYTTVLGPSVSGATRINLAQTCNALGTFLGRSSRVLSSFPQPARQTPATARFLFHIFSSPHWSSCSSCFFGRQTFPIFRRKMTRKWRRYRVWTMPRPNPCSAAGISRSLSARNFSMWRRRSAYGAILLITSPVRTCPIYPSGWPSYSLPVGRSLAFRTRLGLIANWFPPQERFRPGISRIWEPRRPLPAASSAFSQDGSSGA